ncbi:MAG: FecR domain-containing protein [Pseudomonadota bacterium]
MGKVGKSGMMLLAGTLALSSGFVQAQDIGTVAAVNPQMEGTPPASGKRPLLLGANVIQNERVQTSDAGSGQLMFIDQTTLTVAPLSDIVLDKYVYDPERDAGEVALSLTRGVLRMIGGRITKKTDGIVRTPVATIGIRGGLVLIVVSGDGTTRIIHVAGEYSRIVTDKGVEIYLSRPNASVVVSGDGKPVFDGLVDKAELEALYRTLEGRGSGGSVVAASQVIANAVREVSEVNSGVKGGFQNDPVSTSGHTFVRDENTIDENREDQDDGVRVIVFEVSSEEDEPVEDTGSIITPTPVTTLPDSTPTPTPTPDDGLPVSTPDPESGSEESSDDNVLTSLSGGTAVSVGGSLSYGAFSRVLQGSLIGEEQSDGRILRVPVPDSGGGAADAKFDTVGLRTNPDTLSVLDIAPGSGLFGFNNGDVTTDSSGAVTGGSFSSRAGDVRGLGFTDPGESFTYVEFVGDGGAGFGLFGVPLVGQGQFFPSNATLTPNSDTAFDLTATIDPSLAANPEIVNGIANTVEAFELQENLIPNATIGGGVRPNQTPLYMIGNEGFSRFERQTTLIDTGSQILSSNLEDGGKWLLAALEIDEDISSLFVFGDDIRSYDVSGPIAAATGVGSTRSFVPIVESINFVQATSFGRTNLGTFEDAAGNTIFGQENQYLVLSSLYRDGLDGTTSVPPAFSGTLGGKTTLTRQAGSLIIDNTQSRFEESSGDTGINFSLGVRDPSQSETVNNPLPLAGARIETSGQSIPDPQQVDVLDRGYFTGVAVCSGGECGDVDNFRTAQQNGQQGIDDFTGYYTVRGGSLSDFAMTFGGHSIDSQGNRSGYDTSNSVDVSFQLRSNGTGNVVNSNAEGLNDTFFRFSAGGETSAFIDDNRFAAVAVDRPVEISPSGSTPNTTASIAIASSGLVGTGDLFFPAGTDISPQYARWGWWSAEYIVDVQDQPNVVTQRKDIVHLGTWVGGVTPDRAIDDIPTSGVARFNGLTAGTVVNIDTAQAQPIGGNFQLDYDFGSNSGGLQLNIPGAGLNDTISVRGSSRGVTYFGNQNTGTVITNVDGTFLANPSGPGVSANGRPDGIAATGGQYTSTDLQRRQQTTGIFAGDRTAYEPDNGS